MRRRLLVALFAVCYAYFVVFFSLARVPWQPTVDLAWLVASVAWLGVFWRHDEPSAPRLEQPYWFYALYFLALVPFATNWRWALTGDNLQWPLTGLAIAERGRPGQTLLSVNGADNFGFLQTNLHNLFMYLVEPTIFWHRVGKIAVGTCALAAIYTVFARLERPAFGLLIAACSATCSVWIVYTYASVPFLDGLASGFALLAIALWVRRDPDSLRAWLVLGWWSGFMLFLTPNGWFMAACVWPWLAAQAVIRRWQVHHLILAATTAGIVGTPMLLQWMSGQGGQLFSLVENPGWTTGKVWTFLEQAATLPFASNLDRAGAFGPQLPWGFRWLFVLGVLTTPFFPRRFPNARFVLALMMVHVVILAFAQGPYLGVSVKRALVLIPMATYFVFLPFASALRHTTVVLAIVAVWASFGVYDVVARIQPGRVGYTLLDGALEAYQRFAPAEVCVYLGDDRRAAQLRPGNSFYRLYQLDERLRLVASPQDATCEILCYCSQEHCHRIDLAEFGYSEIELRNTTELACGRMQR